MAPQMICKHVVNILKNVWRSDTGDFSSVHSGGISGSYSHGKTGRNSCTKFQVHVVCYLSGRRIS